MLKVLKQLLKAFFTLNKGEQRAIIILLVLTVLVTIFNLLLPRFITTQVSDHTQFEASVRSFRNEQQSIFDSIQIDRLQSRGELDLALAQQKLKPFKFDPNNLPEELWKQMGLTERQIKVIKNYEYKGGSFRTPKDLERMYCISEAEFQVLKPYINIKSPFKTMSDNPIEIKKRKYNQKKKKVPNYQIVDLNAADTAELSRSLYFPEWLAKRVIKYRDLLGGFSEFSQLNEVYGIDSNRVKKLRNYIIVDPTNLEKINLNTGEFKRILKHPYISYDITKEIVNSRKKEGEYKSTEELIDREIISESLYIKLKPYLTVKGIDN
jgi:DNA uptake protein ComE-like DNA-binding protein